MIVPMAPKRGPVSSKVPNTAALLELGLVELSGALDGVVYGEVMLIEGEYACVEVDPSLDVL